jgi:hypothetical protein
MKNQLPKRPGKPEDPTVSGTATPRPQAWGYRSRYFPQGHAALDIAVYRVMLCACGPAGGVSAYVMYQRPANVYSVGLN